MSTHPRSLTILVTEAAALVPLGPRRFRQLCGLETREGRASLELSYAAGRAVINREKALAEVARLRAARCAKARDVRE
jgi:hypothetical protein